MKNLKTTLVILLLLSATQIYAQNTDANFRQGIKKGIDMLHNIKSISDFPKAANYFDRIAQAETKEWLPVYYAAYSNLMAGLTSTDNTTKDGYLDKALAELEQADKISPENSEIYALKGSVQFMKLSVDPQSRLSFMSSSSASLAKAKTLDPNNPRTDLIIGQNTFYRPEAFGGGKAKAKPFLESAVSKFVIFKPANDIMPDWGANTAKDLLEKCN